MRQVERLRLYMHGVTLTNFLNTGPRAGRERIAEIVNLLHAGGPAPRWERDESGYDVRDDSAWKGLTSANRIHRAVARYKLPLRVDIPIDYLSDPHPPHPRNRREPEAARSLVEVINSGMIDLVRRCHCGSWFSALEHRSQKNCTKACRQKKFSDKEEVQKKRENYLKKRSEGQTQMRIEWAAECAVKSSRETWDVRYKQRIANHVNKCRSARKNEKRAGPRVIGVKWVSLHEQEIREEAKKRLSSAAVGHQRIRHDAQRAAQNPRPRRT